MREFITYTLDKPEDVSGPYQRAVIGQLGPARASTIRLVAKQQRQRRFLMLGGFEQ